MKGRWHTGKVQREERKYTVRQTRMGESRKEESHPPRCRQHCLVQSGHSRWSLYKMMPRFFFLLLLLLFVRRDQRARRQRNETAGGKTQRQRQEEVD